MHTGRYFKCIGLEEVMYPHWSQFFKIDEVYPEIVDPYQCNMVSTCLCFEDKISFMYADKTQFQEVMPPIINELLKELKININN